MATCRPEQLHSCRTRMQERAGPFPQLSLLFSELANLTTLRLWQPSRVLTLLTWRVRGKVQTLYKRGAFLEENPFQFHI